MDGFLLPPLPEARGIVLNVRPLRCQGVCRYTVGKAEPRQPSTADTAPLSGGREYWPKHQGNISIAVYLGSDIIWGWAIDGG